MFSNGIVCAAHLPERHKIARPDVPSSALHMARQRLVCPIELQNMYRNAVRGASATTDKW